MNYCANGHALTDDNVYVWNGKRHGCKTCRREHQRASRARLRRGEGAPRSRRDPASRFMKHVRKTRRKSGCWDWTGAAKDLYGAFQITPEQGPIRAHRAAWLLFRGDIPDGLAVDHLCRRPICVNPDHLELVTTAENNRRAGEARDTCRNGHPRVEGLVRVETTKQGWTRRRCLVCEGIASAVALWEQMSASPHAIVER